MLFLSLNIFFLPISNSEVSAKRKITDVMSGEGGGGKKKRNPPVLALQPKQRNKTIIHVKSVLE